MVLDWVDARDDEQKEQHPIDENFLKWKRGINQKVVPIVIRITQENSPARSGTDFIVRGNVEGVDQFHQYIWHVSNHMMADARYDVLKELVTDKINHMIHDVAKELAQGQPYKIVKKYNDKVD